MADPNLSSVAWPLIGRDAELAEIANALRDRERHGVVVMAAAGVGKSRLAREAYAAAERDAAPAGWVQATRSAAAVPLGAFAGLLPDEVRSDDTLELMRRSAGALQERAGGRRLLLGVDDAQLLDPVSAALVLHLATSAGAFILATVRSGEPCPDAIVSLWKDGAAQRVELDRLTDADVAALVEAALGGPLEEAALRWVTDSSQGNALYVHELVTGAVESGALAFGDGLWRLTGRPRVSPSLSELIAERMAGLADEQRAPVELLALGEPLRLPELASLATHDALLEAESHGLIVMDSGLPQLDEVRLAHPLFGEVVSGALPALRARELRLRIASTLERRDPLSSDDALRIARLLLDAGAEIPDDLQLVAARAANLAGDPDLGASLAERALATGGLTAALLLGRAHVMRNRDEEAEAVFAEAEALAPGHPDAFDYLMQRVWLLYWGLHRAEDTLALIERARAWAESPEWAARVEQLHRSQRALMEGFSGSGRTDEGLADADLDEMTRRSLVALDAMAKLFAGRGDEASEIARRIRPKVPLRDLADTASLGTSSLVSLETGNDWPSVEAYMTQTVREAVRVNDHDAAGIAAFNVAGMRFMRGSYRDAARWFAESELHFGRHDTFGSIVHVRCYQVGLAYFTGDFDRALAALERLEATVGPNGPLPNQLPYVLRARGWAARVRSDAEAAAQLLRDAEAIAETPVYAAQLAYEARRAGAKAAATAAIEAAASRCETRLVSAYAAHAAARDGTALLAVAEEMAAIGALVYATEAAVEAATAFLREGRRDSAHRAAARARELFLPDAGAEPPRIDGLDTTAIELTPREAQLVELASRGLSNAEIADRLVLSVRTVESHIYRAMQKLGVNDRRQL
jgi:DNA-binding NarL/FixJ family response regulator